VILFGHSLGAYIACGIASNLVSNGLQPNLILCAAQPPHLREVHVKLSSLPIDMLATILVSLNGLPESWSRTPELLELYEETLRADFKMYENFAFPKNISNLNALSINGYQDCLCSPQYAFEWAQYFKNIHIDFLSGNHLFLNESPEQVANITINFLKDKLF
jgi:surfactin synthase thioesterase subunit